MNRNSLNAINDLSRFLSNIDNEKDIADFMVEILTKSELETLSKRWCILNMIKSGMTQRSIAKELQVSLCKVTRGSKILKDKNSITAKYLAKEKYNGSSKSKI